MGQISVPIYRRALSPPLGPFFAVSRKAAGTKVQTQLIAAQESRELDTRRLENYRKIMREQTINSATLAEKRYKDKALGKFIRSVQSESRRRKHEP